MARSSVPPTVVAFVNRWLALFNTRDWKRLQKHEAPDPDAKPDKNGDTYIRAQAKVGARAVLEKLGPYTPPRWPIMRTHDYVPTPTFWADTVFVRSDGGRNESYLAISPRPNGKGWCAASLEERPTPKKAAPFDLDKESARVGKLVAAAVKRFARRKDKRPVQAMVLTFSEEQGTLTISFDLNPSYEPGELERMTHYGFEEIMVPQWAEADEATAAQLGKMLVARLLVMRDASAFDVLRPSETGELGVEEIDGHFGWPPYAQRGRKNRLARTPVASSKKRKAAARTGSQR